MVECDNLEQRVRSVVDSNVDPLPTRVTGRRDKLKADLGLDSLDLWSIAMDLEETFGMRLTDPEVEAWSTFGDVVDLVARKLAHA